VASEAFGKGCHPCIGPPILAGQIPSLKPHPIIRICCLPPIQPSAFPGDGSCPQLSRLIPFHLPGAGPVTSRRHFFLPGSHCFVASASPEATRPGRPLPGQDSLLLEKRAFTHGAHGPVHRSDEETYLFSSNFALPGSSQTRSDLYAAM